MTLLRRWFMIRERFHDWMWGGGPGYGWTPRRLARRLPLHFSDPYYVTPEKFDELFAKGSPIITAGSPWIRVEPNSTATVGTSTTWVYTTNTTWDRRSG